MGVCAPLVAGSKAFEGVQPGEPALDDLPLGSAPGAVTAAASGDERNDSQLVNLCSSTSVTQTPVTRLGLRGRWARSRTLHRSPRALELVWKPTEDALSAAFEDLDRYPEANARGGRPSTAPTITRRPFGLSLPTNDGRSAPATTSMMTS